MKITSYLFIFLFTVVLSAPMAFDLCDVNVEISSVLTLGEEEKIDTNLCDSEQLNFEEIVVASIAFCCLQRTIPFNGDHKLWNSYYLDNGYPPPESYIF